ncbi:MAG: DUF4309 domain-containing protein [Pelosinus sp.]|nr:DUF4309 domain-containing protein [Pelosinus sp.]
MLELVYAKKEMSEIIRVLLILNILLVMGVNLCFADVNTTDFTFNGINILTGSYQDIMTKLGEPKKKIVDETGSPAFTYLSYPNIHIQTYNDSGKIAFVKIEDRDYKTARGIAIGSTPYKVVKEYGQPEKLNIGHIYYVYKLADAAGYRLMFDMTDGYVTRIIFTNLTDKP